MTGVAWPSIQKTMIEPAAMLRVVAKRAFATALEVVPSPVAMQHQLADEKSVAIVTVASVVPSEMDVMLYEARIVVELPVNTTQNLAALGWKCWRPGVTKTDVDEPASISAWLATGPGVKYSAPLTS